jgi:hypothetical protein
MSAPLRASASQARQRVSCEALAAARATPFASSPAAITNTASAQPKESFGAYFLAAMEEAMGASNPKGAAGKTPG